MAQVSPVLKRGASGFWHWCPGCESMHPLPDSWVRTGTLDVPSFSPSFRQINVRHGKDCHYNIEDGQIVWHPDSWHGRSGKEPMAILAEVGMADENWRA